MSLYINHFSVLWPYAGNRTSPRDWLLPAISHILKLIKPTKMCQQLRHGHSKLKPYRRHLELYNNTFHRCAAYLSCCRKERDSGNFQLHIRLIPNKYPFRNCLNVARLVESTGQIRMNESVCRYIGPKLCLLLI